MGLFDSPDPLPPAPPPQELEIDDAAIARRNAKKVRDRVSLDDLRIDPGVRTTDTTGGLKI